MGDSIKLEVSKLSKAKHGVPWAAVLVASIGMWEARQANNTSDAAVLQAEVSKVESSRISEVRLKNAYKEIQSAISTHSKAITAYEQRVGDLEDWVVELEGWVEVLVDKESPRTSRAREAQALRLEAIRSNKRARATKASQPSLGKAAELPDYEAL